MAATPTGDGYYLVLANGEVHIVRRRATLRQLGRHADLAYLHLNKPIVAMAVTPSGTGYWLVAVRRRHLRLRRRARSTAPPGNIHLVSPVIGMFAAVDGLGYYMYAADGGMFTFQKPRRRCTSRSSARPAAPCGPTRSSGRASRPTGRATSSTTRPGSCLQLRAERAAGDAACRHVGREAVPPDDRHDVTAWTRSSVDQRELGGPAVRSGATCGCRDARRAARRSRG